jgi:hypothetical protein
MEATASTESPTTGEIRPFTVDILQEDAWEEPELLSEEVRAAFGPLR